MRPGMTILRTAVLLVGTATLALAAQACAAPSGENDDQSGTANGGALRQGPVGGNGRETGSPRATPAATGSPSTPPSSAPTGSAPPSSSSPPPPPPAAPTGASLVFAEVGRELSNMTSSTYSHTTYVDETTGVYDFDCSGFIGYALGRAVPTAMSEVSAATESRPLAKDFESFFASFYGSKGAWSHVHRVSDLVPGDVIAWLEPPTVVSRNTGHVLIVMGAPHSSASRADEMLVPIADATSTPHGSADARTAAGTNGLGTATIGLVVDGSGAPTGYYWSGDASPTAQSTTVSLGHVN